MPVGDSLDRALATVVGVLIEVTVMLLLVRWVDSSKDWNKRGQAA